MPPAHPIVDGARRGRMSLLETGEPHHVSGGCFGRPADGPAPFGFMAHVLRSNQDMQKAGTNREEVLRDVLVHLRDMTYERVKELRKDQEQELEPGPADEMDLARATADVETHAGLIARAEEKLRFIDEAISRLERGKYGECVGCHEPISVERLAALPFASYCVECQTKRNRAKRGWGTGGTIPPYDQQWTLPEEMVEPGEAEHVSTGVREMEEEIALSTGEPFGPRASRSGRRRGRPRKRPAE